MTTPLGTALITGASEGIGAVYADRLARRGYDLVLVARNRDKLTALAAQLAADTGRKIEVLPADLTNAADLATVEARLQHGSVIDILVNNAGTSTLSSFAGLTSDQLSNMIALNVTALTRLSWAATTPMVARGAGTIINIGSVVALGLLDNAALYAATKAFVLTLTQTLHRELADKGIRLQAVLPGATRTDLWAKSGVPVEHLPQDIVMETSAMVDAALLGLDRGELITIPPLADTAGWDAFDAARLALDGKLSNANPAPRYLA